MKNSLLALLTLISIFSLSFYHLSNSGASEKANPTNASAGVQTTEKLLNINFVWDDSLKNTLLKGVSIKRIRKGAQDLDTTYDGSPIDIPVQNGDQLIFSKSGKETLGITINNRLHLKKISIFMFRPKLQSQNDESIEGTAKDQLGRNSAGMNILINSTNPADSITTDTKGLYKKSIPRGTSFNITYFIDLSQNNVRASITATTQDDGGRTVIDVAFDDDGTLGGEK